MKSRISAMLSVSTQNVAASRVHGSAGLTATEVPEASNIGMSVYEFPIETVLAASVR